jgi:hypothetical protein
MKATINGITFEGTMEELQAMALQYRPVETTRKPSSAKGTIREGSSHWLWNHANADVKATIIKEWLTANMGNHKVVNHYSMFWTALPKPAGITWAMYLATKPVIDCTELTVKADKEIEKSGFNQSRIASIVRWYQQTTIAMLEKIDYQAPLIVTSTETKKSK